MTDELPNPSGYGGFLREVTAQIRQHQYQALRAANKELLALYWWLGGAIHDKQAQLGWGKAVVETLARDLQAEFPGRNGFSARNLWNMRDFYLNYTDHPKLQPLVAEISWSKNLLIMARCKDELEREFYLRATARFGWTKNVLQHQLDQSNRLEGENPPIGIVICRNKSKTIVEYALRNMNRPLGVATYTVTPQLPANYQGDLPSPEAIAARLQAWGGLEEREDE
jgi:predicted nuclease of restriction endonuclease-like (RecB) superfamily